MTAPGYDHVIVGGGFFGCILASHLSRRGSRTLVCERAPDLLQRASFANQARVHNGYHYPRSILTALRSRVNFPRFVAEFPECIDQSFEACYAVPRRYSKVTAAQFATFMRRIGAPIEPAPERIRRLFDTRTIEQVFTVREYAFDAVRLRDHCRRRLDEDRVEVWVDARVMSVAPASDGGIAVTIMRGGRETMVRAGRVLNCTYSEINGLLRASGLQPLRFKHELAELCLVDVPPPINRMGVTVMCGPFFSVMPFPSAGRHTLTHVRYTPHCSWPDVDTSTRDAYDVFDRAPRTTHFPHMIRDAARYLPALRSAQYRDSLWEVKTVLPQSELDDARPILMYRHKDLPGLTSVMGGKIDNVYDAMSEYDADLEGDLP